MLAARLEQAGGDLPGQAGGGCGSSGGLGAGALLALSALLGLALLRRRRERHARCVPVR